MSELFHRNVVSSREKVSASLGRKRRDEVAAQVVDFAILLLHYFFVQVCASIAMRKVRLNVTS